MKVIELLPDGGSRYTVDLKKAIVQLTVRYNYSSRHWTVDLDDAQGNSILSGLALVPEVDLLRPYPQIKKTLGSLVLVELKKGDYRVPDYLGNRTKLLWFAPDEEIVLP